MLQTDDTISSPHLGFGIQIIPRKKVLKAPYQDERHPNDQWKNDKLLTLLDGRTRFLSFDFRYENDIWPWMFEQHRWMAYSHFFAGLIHHPTHASARRKSSLTFRLVLSLYKSFSLWKQHKAIFKMKIILLLLDEKQGDSEQHGCFSLGFIHHPIQLFPSNHPINTRLFSKDDGSWRIRHTFLIVIIIIYKKESDTSSRRIRHIHYP